MQIGTGNDNQGCSIQVFGLTRPWMDALSHVKVLWNVSNIDAEYSAVLAGRIMIGNYCYSIEVVKYW